MTATGTHVVLSRVCLSGKDDTGKDEGRKVKTSINIQFNQAAFPI